jgi:branched-chain amino acid transport system substrate-binding protein
MLRKTKKRSPLVRSLGALRLVAAGSIAVVALGACGGPAGNQGGDTKTDKVKLGAILPLTGATAQNGNNSRKGIELAVEKINEAGGISSMGGAKIELEVQDGTSDPGRAASAATQFVSAGEAPLAIVGAYASSLTVTVARVTERQQVPLLTTSFSDELTQQGYKYLFQLPAAASVLGKAQMSYASEIASKSSKPIKRAAIVYANNAYGESQAKGLKAQAEQSGIEVALFEGYAPTISDAGPVAQKIIASNSDAIFSVAYVNDGVLLMRALQSQGNTVPVIGGVGGFITPDFQKSLGTQVDGVLSVTTSDPDKYGDLGQAYLKKYGEFMPQEAHDNAAAVYVFAQALEQNPTTDSTKLAQSLRDGSFDKGAAGSMPGGKVDFDEKGVNTVAAPLMVQWQKGALVGVWPNELTDSEPTWTGK